VKRRLIQAQGWVVLSILDHEWRALGSDQSKISAMRRMLEPHIQSHAEHNGRAAGAGAQPAGYGGGEGQPERQRGEASPGVQGAQQVSVPQQHRSPHAFPPQTPQQQLQQVSHMLAQQRAMQQRAAQQMHIQQQMQMQRMQQHGPQPHLGSQQEQHAAAHAQHNRLQQQQQQANPQQSMRLHPSDGQDQI
jgi:hypothetical protein